MTKIGIIGGSGLENPNILEGSHEFKIVTPYGEVQIKQGKIKNIDVVLLSRHGKDHTIPPTQINNRANIYALKEMGCTAILATTACGSLREDIGRGDLVILDQFIDFTCHRHNTFFTSFDSGEIKHTPMADPFSESLRNIIINSAEKLGIKHHKKGTVITIEGPRFSTRAESHMFRAWGADIINMSTASEAILANEIGLPYATIAISTDYDCWKEDEDPVSWEEVIKIFNENVNKVIKLLINTIENMNEEFFDLKKVIRTIPDWPKPGIMFRDITTLLENPDAFDFCIRKFKERYESSNITKIAGIESRGFIFGAALARELKLPLILIRKKGKLPAETMSEEYELEYGTDQVEVHKDAVEKHDRILVIDDLLATGGTMRAACNLLEKLDAEIASIAVVIDLPDLNGKEKLKEYDICTLVEFEGE
jgi:5'-methylthioadenosine phosphorylase